MTEINFTCSHCQQHLAADASMIGEEVECGACSKAVIVPEPPDSRREESDGLEHDNHTCPYCRSPIEKEDEPRICSDCQTPHHEDCWEENKGCTVFGCTMAPPDEEKISVDAPINNSQQQQPPPPPNRDPILLYIPMRRFVMLSILAPGIFHAYWLFKNFQYIREKDDSPNDTGWNLLISFKSNFFNIDLDSNQMSPFWRGILGVFYCHGLLRALKKDDQLQAIEKASFRGNILAAGWVFLTLIGALLAASKEAHLSFLGALGLMTSFAFLLPVHDYIIRLNRRSAPHNLHKAWSIGQSVCVVAGIVFWVALFFRMAS